MIAASEVGISNEALSAMPGEDLTAALHATKKPKVQNDADISLASITEKAAEARLGTAPGRGLTLEEIQKDNVTKIAAENWSPTAVENNVSFNPDLVREIYASELEVKSGNKSVPLHRAMLLEISQYLERYLWPNFDAETASFEHVFSIVLMVNEKVGVW